MVTERHANKASGTRYRVQLSANRYVGTRLASLTSGDTLLFSNRKQSERTWSKTILRWRQSLLPENMCCEV